MSSGGTPRVDATSAMTTPRGGLHETQESVHEWRVATFGQADPPESVALRMAEEVGELLALLGYGDSMWRRVKTCQKETFILANDKAEIADELADVQVLLWGAASAFGIDLGAAVDRKMGVNRARRWDLDGKGGGQHAPTANPIARELRTKMGVPFANRLRHIRDTFGEGKKLNVVFTADDGLSYPVHFKEGMAVRNLLRKSEACFGWSAQQLDDRWEALALEAIR